MAAKMFFVIIVKKLGGENNVSYNMKIILPFLVEQETPTSNLDI